MATGGQRKTRSERVAALGLPPGTWAQAWAGLRRRNVLLRIGLCAMAAVLLCVVMGGWHPPFPYRTGQVPAQPIQARVPFGAPPRLDSHALADGQVRGFAAGETLVVAAQPLGSQQIRVLQAEHEAWAAGRTLGQRLARGAALLSTILALFAVCGLYLGCRHPELISSFGRLALILALAVITVALARWAGTVPRHAEIIPLLLFGQTIAIAYRRQLALLFAGVVTLLTILALGQDLGALLILTGVTATAILQLGRVRNRSKLIYIAASAGLAAFVLTVGVAVLENRAVDRTVLRVASLNVLWTLSAGFLMTGLLSFVERLFGVMTDISLLELGDMSRPLMQELVQRAPGTYNHSIIVGSIAEAAADAIAARGLLARVGAYYHDIGKLLKPVYFIENQAPNDNLHQGLVPTMSTLVIVAHVKDGANLARQHGLPQVMIDFIEQHHGTTLVEYFFGRAHEQRQLDPDGGDVEESSYRYPGPKPQTKEASVLMLADSAESACRALVDPTPARIESTVREVAKRKLEDGQFDQSGLTLRELRTIQDSMIKSLVANYHGRIKYPDQRTA